MKKLTAVVFVVIFSSLGLYAKGGRTVVWDHPVADLNYNNHEGYFKSIISPTRVEFTPQQTIVDFEVYFRPDFRFTISSKSVLIADNKEYALKSAENIILDKKTYCPDRKPKNFRLIFEPLPLETKKFDFKESKDYFINGITDPAVTAHRLIPSTWRNDLTGDWEIGLFNEGVVYDAKFWDYVGATRPVDGGTFQITDGEKTLDIKIGKLKNGTRKFRIGNRGETVCSMITTRTLPDYPVADTRDSFRDNRYALGDTAILRGWLKDCPGKIKLYALSGKKLIPAGYGNLAVCDVDSLGRFTLKVPLINSTECFFDWKNTFIRTVLEPGETYYLLYDFGRGQKLFMGADCRVQNELLSYPLSWSKLLDSVLKEDGADAFQKASEEDLKDELANLDSLYAEHPSLSTRYKVLNEGNIYSQIANNIGQSRFGTPDRLLTDKSVAFLSDIVRNHPYTPYTLHREYFSLMKDFSEDYLRRAGAWYIEKNEITKALKDNNPTPEETDLIEKCERLDVILNQNLNQLSDSTERKEFEERFRSEHSQILDSMTKLLSGKRVENMVPELFLIKGIDYGINFLDSLGADDDAKSIWLTQNVAEYLDHTHRPFSQVVENYINDNVNLPDLKKLILEKNEEYKALEQRTKGSSSPRLISDLNLPEGVKNGKILFDSITAPHKGKIILLDVWGTWCAPCRLALAESQKEYQELAPYDMVYIYLANNSPEDSWKNLIEEYNIKGDNCYHYNLPHEQQELIERYIQITGYPTYRLIDRDGNLLPYNVDARNLKDMKYILDKL